MEITPRLSGEDFEQIANGSGVGIYGCDARGKLAFYNKAAADLWGKIPERGIDNWAGAWKMYFPDGNAMGIDQHPVPRVLAGEKIEGGVEMIIENADQNYSSFLVFVQSLSDNTGQLKMVITTLVDITAYKTGGEKQAMLSAIVDSSDDAIISKSLDGIIKSWNAGARKMFGYPDNEIIGKHISILIPEHLQSEEDVIIGNILKGKTVDHFHTVRLHKTGRMIPVSLTISPVKDNFGNITGASKIARDISERVQADEITAQVAHKMEILNSIGKTISEKLDVQVILQKVTDATTNITGAAFGAFFYNTIDEKGESFMLYALSGAPREAFDHFGMPRNTEVFHPTFSGQSVVRIEDISKDPRYGRNAPHMGMPKGHLPVVSYMAVPVISASGRVIGGLFFGHPDAGVFREEHEDLIVSIASQAAVAIDNSILFEEVQALSAKKDEFIALASHELKTPLTGMKGYLQILDRSVMDTMGKTYVGKLLKQLEKLESLVADLFDISKIEAGKLTFSYEIFDLGDLLSEVIESIQFNTSAHIITIEHGGAGVKVEADRHRIEQVITNLLGNAIKYSPNGGPVNVKLESNSTEAFVYIRDQGLGMTAQQLGNIFTRFYRAENSSGASGLGLGLYLSKEIIDRHGGEISVNSKPLEGSEFLFRIPLRKK